MRRRTTWATTAAQLALILALAAVGGTASAGPPFRTDDPEPVPEGHWEIFQFSTATHASGDTAGTLAGIDANYGAAPDLQLHATFPLAFDKAEGRELVAGYGDTEFLAEDESGWRPQAAIYPLVDVPMGDAARSLGTGRTHAFLPLWVQKSVGDWTTFAGAGYWINPGPGNRNYWYFGWVVQRPITQNLSLGGELFHQTATTAGSKDQTGFDLGLTYDLSEHYHLLDSLGPGLQNARTTDVFTYYAALRCTF
jgi:hypothetical protein